jgi:hypothetical protein
MSTCKKCGKQTSFLNSICTDCKKEEEEIVQKEIMKKEVEEIGLKKIENEKLTEEVRTLVNSIVNSSTKDEILMYSFFQNDVILKENKGTNIGLYVGGALGGVMGATVGSVLFDNPSSYSYTGNIGILVVTKENIIIKYFSTDIYPGRIYYEQLKRLSSKISTKINLQVKSYSISKSQILNNEIRSKYDKFKFDVPKIYLNENNIITPPTNFALKDLCKELGSLPSVEEFIECVIQNIKPLNDNQFDHLKNNKPFFNLLADQIVANKNRDLLIDNIKKLEENLQNLIIDGIKEQIKHNGIIIMSIIILVSIFIIIFSLLGLYSDSFEDFIYLIFAVALVLSSIVFLFTPILLIKLINSEKPLRYFINKLQS